MDRTGTPSQYWLLCTLYAIMLSNHMAGETLGWRTPTEAAFNVKPDISPFLHHYWWEKVLFESQESFPKSREWSGRWVGIAPKQGNILTYWILDGESKHVATRSNVKSFNSPTDSNLRSHLPVIDEQMQEDDIMY